MSVVAPGYFESSRRLTGPNLYFAGPGAVIEVPSATEWQCARWRERVLSMCHALAWPAPEFAIDVHRNGASLAFTADADFLFTATEINEWAWQGVGHVDPAPALPLSPGYPATNDFADAVATLRRFAAAELLPRSHSLAAFAQQRALPVFRDDEEFSIGAGEGSISWPLDELPESLDEATWQTLHDIPTVLVTGSNGKTTTVRLLAAILSASGRRAGFNCTDGIFVDGEEVESGDYSGPAGARKVLRDKRVQAAVLETARGAILRRGLAVSRADGAIVTNISADHFGEYGVHDLERLADAKLVVARALGAQGFLVLNADDPVLADKSRGLDCALGWFSLDDRHPLLVAHRTAGGATCGVADGRMVLHSGGLAEDIGPVAGMPLTMAGAAGYNISNAAGAALAAACLGVPSLTIAGTLARFGRGRDDNPGRLERWRYRGASVLIDYAHNPDGLEALLGVARAVRGDTAGRVGLLLGQAGNRDDQAIVDLAHTAAAARPDRVILKDLDGYMRGRQPGEVPAILSKALQAGGLPAEAIDTVLAEVDAAREILRWSRPGDVVVLPVHNLQARAELLAWLVAEQAERPGTS